MTEILRRIGFERIGGRLYSIRRLRAEANRRLHEFDRPDILERFAQFGEIQQRRRSEGRVRLLMFAYLLGLHESSPIKVLDIGTYSGMFPRLCESYGHFAMGADLPGVLESGPASEIHRILGIRTMPLRILPFEKMPEFPERFDLVTGLRTRFHSTKPKESGLGAETHWGVDEWRFFLRDLAGRLNSGGRIFFALNRLQPKENGQAIPDHMAEFFRGLGGDLKGNYLTFNDVSQLLKS